MDILKCASEYVRLINKLADSIPLDKAYDILGVTPDATKNEIKASYKKLVQLHHPDKNPNSNKIVEINRAFKVLMDHDPKDTVNIQNEDEIIERDYEDAVNNGALWEMEGDDASNYVDVVEELPAVDRERREEKLRKYITRNVKRERYTKTKTINAEKAFRNIDWTILPIAVNKVMMEAEKLKTVHEHGFVFPIVVSGLSSGTNYYIINRLSKAITKIYYQTKSLEHNNGLNSDIFNLHWRIRDGEYKEEINQAIKQIKDISAEFALPISAVQNVLDALYNLANVYSKFANEYELFINLWQGINDDYIGKLTDRVHAIACEYEDKILKLAQDTAAAQKTHYQQIVNLNKQANTLWDIIAKAAYTDQIKTYVKNIANMAGDLASKSYAQGITKDHSISSHSAIIGVVTSLKNLIKENTFKPFDDLVKALTPWTPVALPAQNGSTKPEQTNPENVPNTTPVPAATQSNVAPQISGGVAGI